MLTASPLTYSDIFQFAPRVRIGDLKETDGQAVHAMSFALRTKGEKWIVNDGPFNRVGAFGWTENGAIWSLWSDLTLGQAKQVFQETPKWVSHMVEASGRDFLENHVDQDNKMALRWLKASRCFIIDKHTVILSGRDCPSFHFRTKLKGASV